ncbi:FAD/NAD(P)-binding domain-containing protein [Stemphylium lycopersici]|nr:FAD/NAD(P)-binding domain-containing protein [Stemphylium lycopersici]
MSSSNNRTSLRARTVAIVGAGPSGVVAAKYLRAENAFDKIVLLEQRSRSGGIWIYTGDQRDENLFSIPQTDPNKDVQKPEWKSARHLPGRNTDTNGMKGAPKLPSFLSPMYEKLETNIPRGLMGFQDHDWPSSSQLFPTHETVLEYIESYSADVQDLVQYCTQVTNIVPVSPDSSTTAWTVTATNLLTKSTTSEVFDAVIVANGHFIVPYVPPMPGIQDWANEHPGAISHSKYYRRPEDFSGKKVVVVGNSASGADISAQIARHSAVPLLWSSRSESLFSATHGAVSASPARHQVPPISAFLPATRGVRFADGSEAHGVDAVVFATGYLYSLPFLSGVEPPLITTGERVHHTYKHLFYAPRPTLSFLTLNQRVIPFPVAEAQAAVLARVYAGRLSLPPLQEMVEWEHGVVDDMGDGKNFHLLPFPKDAEYINEMSAWAMEAGPEGKTPPVWGEWEFWCRERFPRIRAAFGALGEKRKHVRGLEELGFDFEGDMEEKRKDGEMGRQ